ncbi:cytochrome b/b6 domain-containing protein [Rhizobium sp. CCGE 510]|uniref:cytochrome b n=1 Tax=Rhizobium sp. CCGE 510 TaxID=1132836 RepID=UPI00027B936C|nr:cytochrome b/b6 domain-containing protein [Rhizobium sp. CCGE 510]EJT04322.1 cytochrome b561 family protein 2 [Rhizobium sp. CCGE 510]
MALDQAAAPPRALADASRYDRLTISLHWLTALLVVALFAAAYVWNALPHGTPMRKSLQAIHISLGLLFTVAFIVRLVWRSSGGRRLAPAEAGITSVLSKGMHWLLYGLLIAQMVLGFLLRWAQGEPFSFFGLFSVPSLLAPDKPLSKTYEWLHNDAAWIIIVLAAGHALAALAHHYFLRDSVLKRMLPHG